MNITITSVHFNADTKLEQWIEDKINKLAKHHEDIIGAEVFLRLDNTQDRENKISEIKLDVPGVPLFAKKQSSSFEKSTDVVLDALRKQLERYKEKR